MAYYSQYSSLASGLVSPANVWCHDPYATGPEPTAAPRAQPTAQPLNVRPALATPLVTSFLPVMPQLHQHHYKHHHHQEHHKVQQQQVTVALRSGEHVVVSVVAGANPPPVGSTVVIEIPPGAQERSAVRAIGVVAAAGTQGEVATGAKVLRPALVAEEAEWNALEKDERAALEWFRDRARALPGFEIIAVEYQQLVDPGTSPSASWSAGDSAERRRLLVRYTAKRRRANFARLLHDGFRRFRCRVWMSPTSTQAQQLQQPSTPRHVETNPASETRDSTSPSSESSLVPPWVDGELGFDGDSVLPSPDLLIAASLESMAPRSMPPSPPPSSGGSLSWADDEEEMDFTQPPQIALLGSAPIC